MTTVAKLSEMPEKIRRIIEETGRMFAVTMPEMIGQRRHKHIAHARQVAMYLIRKDLNHSLETIGRYFGDRDHTTVLHACQAVHWRLEKDDELKQQLEHLRVAYKQVLVEA